MKIAEFRSRVLAGALLLVAGGASAATFTNVPSGATSGLPFAYFGNGANPSGDSPAVGEVILLTSEQMLASFSFYAVGNLSQSLQLNVAQWNPDTNAKNQAVNGIGSVLLTTIGAPSESFNAATGVTTIEFDHLALDLRSDTKYVVFLTSADPAATGIQLSRTQTSADVSGFGVGNAFLSTVPGTGWQLPFNGNGFLSMQYTAVVAAVPEPGSWAMLMAGFGLVGTLVKRLRANAA